MSDRRGPVEVEIEALAVEAAGPYRADLLARAVEEELARLLSASGLGLGLLHDREVRALDAGQLGNGHGSGAGAMGTAVARAVHAALARGLGE